MAILAEEALAAFINPAEITEPEKIGAQGMPQLTEANISKIDGNGAAKIRKTDSNGAARTRKTGRTGAAKINKTDRRLMMTTGITTGMVATTIMAATIITAAAGADIMADWR